MPYICKIKLKVMNEENNYDRSYHPVNLGEFYRNGQEVVSKQETLEEVADNYSKNKLSSLAFIAGAKWQQEQSEKMYTEEEVYIIAKNAFELYRNNTLDDEELEQEFERVVKFWLKKK